MGTTRGYIKKEKWGWGVGAKYFTPDKDNDWLYHGPYARVEYDKDWLHICTDDYEGHAMLNIEALPYLRRALAAIAKELRDKERLKRELNKTRRDVRAAAAPSE